MIPSSTPGGPAPGGLDRTRRYDVVDTLGHGGMGVVYKVRDRRTGELRALKTVRNRDAEYLLRLKDEFRAAVDLRHDNLVRLGELVAEDDLWFFTMELVDGVPFTHWVRGDDPEASASDPQAATVADVRLASSPTVEPAPGGRCDEARLRAALEQLAISLGVLHEHGRVHRDVKPSNVLVTDAGRVVLLDFGLTLAPGRTADAPEAAGTIEYMAPEQAHGEAVGPAADWYAVGVLLFQCLTGALPFRGAPLAVLDAKMRFPPPSPSTRAAHVPTDLDDLCAALLDPTPARRPGRDEVLERLARRERPVASPRAPTLGAVPFVGRARELEALRGALARSRQGGAAVLLVGESGIGKTSIAREHAAAAERADATSVTLAGRCHDRESLPFAAFDGVVDDLSRVLRRLPPDVVEAILPDAPGRLARLFPVLARAPGIGDDEVPDDAATPREIRTRGFDLLRELLARLGRRGPLTLIVDDLQWIDSDSLDLMVHVLAAPDSPPVLFVGTTRPDAAALRDRLAARGLAPPELVVVSALDPDDAHALAAEVLIAVGQPGATAPDVATEAQGHPGFIRELARGAHGGGDLDALLGARIAARPNRQRRLLEALCLAPGRLAPGLLARAAGVPTATLDDDLAELRHLDLVGARRGDRDGTEVFEPYHDRVRAALLAGLPAEELRAGHKRMAVALQQTPGAPVEDLYRHWLLAGRRGHAAHYATRAADAAAATLQFHRAAELYAAAIELAEPLEPERRAALQIRLGEALAQTGAGEAAADAMLAAAEVVEADQAETLRRTAAEQLMSAGHYRRGMEVLRAILDAAGLAYPEGKVGTLAALLRARARLWMRGLEPRARPAAVATRTLQAALAASRSLGMVDLIRGSYYQARFLRLALDAGDPTQLAIGYALEAAYVAVGGTARAAAARAVLARAQDAAERAGAPTTPAIELATALIEFFGGRFARTVELADRAAVVAAATPGASWDLRTARIAAAWACWFSGQLRQLAERVHRHLREADACGDRYSSMQLRLGVNNLAWLVADDHAGALRAVDDALAGWPAEDVVNHRYYATIARVNALLYAGEDEAAEATVAREWPAIERSLMLRVPFSQIAMRELRARSALAVAAATTDPRARATRIAAARADARGIRRTGEPWAVGSAALIDAGAAHVAGDADLARTLLLAAATAARTHAQPMIAVTATMALAALDAGDAAAARAPLDAEGVTRPDRIARVVCPPFFL